MDCQTQRLQDTVAELQAENARLRQDAELASIRSGSKASAFLEAGVRGAAGLYPDWVYEAREAIQHQNESLPWLPDLLKALGWEGGTIHQALQAVHRMRESSVAELQEQLEAARRNVDALEQSYYRRDEPLVNWTLVSPTESGWYWHWNGDFDCAPVPTSVLWSGTTGKCFVTLGQLGLTHAIDCEEYGGWWSRLREPSTRAALGDSR